MTADLERIVNNCELRVFGLQRSGIHAIINWIVQQSVGPTVFVNDIKSLTDSPFEDNDDCHLYASADNSIVDAKFDVSRERMNDHLYKKYLVLGYEDTDLRHIPVGFNALLREAVGRSRCFKNVLIIRDPFNLFASRLGFSNTANRLPMETNWEYVTGLWKGHAHECLGETTYLGDNLVVIKFNQWFTDRNYRCKIADDLGLTFSDLGFEVVPGVDLPLDEFARFGCGSSFDNQRFHGRAQQMDVLQRWKRYDKNELYLKFFSDRALVELAERIFGITTGTEILYR